MTGPRIRVLVVEDSPTVRHCLREALPESAGFDVVGEAETGAQAVELCRRLRPDVVTMDVVLPVMDGLAATEEIMAQVPTPILVVSGAERAEAFSTYDALAAGAVDVLEKPRGDASDDGWGQRLRDAVRLVSRIRVVTRHHRQASGPGRPTGPAPGATAAPVARPAGPVRLVAVGSSTGGPGALVELFRALPADFRPPILLVQHIGTSEPFAIAFTDWLADQVGRPVTYARGGEPLAALAGRVVMAPPDRHLVVRGDVLWLTAEPERHSSRPSVDELFESVARECAPAAAGCLLTGMGRDGAAGLLALRRAGCWTFAQTEASCVVYGMPREAALLGAADHVLSPSQIAAQLTALVGAVGAPREPWRTRF